MPTNLDFSYINPTSMMVVSTLLPCLSILAVAGRFYVRRNQQGAKLLWDDWLLIPALLLIIGSAIAQVYGVTAGAVGYTKGIPAGAPPEEELFYLSPTIVIFEQVQFAVQMMQPLVLGCVKASFILFYRRIFYIGHKTWFSSFTVFMLILILVWSIAFWLVFILYCGTHASAIWGAVIGIITYCPHSFEFQEAFAISDFIMDIMIILAPVPAVLGLHLTWGKKLSILAIFMLGLLAIAASAIRMVVVIIAANIGFDVNLDGDIVVGSILFWSMVEDNAALIAACLPTLHFLFKRATIESMVRSVRSKLSLNSLRRSTRTRVSSTHSGSTSAAAKGDSFEKDNAMLPPIPKHGFMKEDGLDGEERYHLQRLQGFNSVESKVENRRSEGREETAEGEIKVTRDVRQEENRV